jgi:hypothetical protein
MMHGGKTLLYVIGASAFWLVANGVARDAAGSPYQGIVERNVFGLKPPPPPPNPEANRPPPPRIFLQGITTFGGVKRALLKAQIPPKPGDKPAGDQSFILAEGQRDGDIEVLEISVVGEASFVKVNDFGTITNLTFEKDGIKGAAGAAPAPGMPVPRTVMAMPGASGGGGGVPAPFVTRPLRPPGGGEAVSPQASGGGGYAPGMPGGAGVNPSVAQQPTEPQLSAEANALMLEVNRLRHADDIQAGRYPALPRHPLMSDAIQQEINGGSSVTTPVQPQQPTLPVPPGGPRPLPLPQ